MQFWLVKENNLYRLCTDIPLKRLNFWDPENSFYFNVSVTLAEKLFPIISKDEILQVNLDISSGNDYYVSKDLNGLYHISITKPEFMSIYNKKLNHLNEFWNVGKEFFVCPEELGNQLFPNVTVTNCEQVNLQF